MAAVLAALSVCSLHAADKTPTTYLDECFCNAPVDLGPVNDGSIASGPVESTDTDGLAFDAEYTRIMILAAPSERSKGARIVFNSRLGLAFDDGDCIDPCDGHGASLPPDEPFRCCSFWECLIGWGC